MIKKLTRMQQQRYDRLNQILLHIIKAYPLAISATTLSLKVWKEYSRAEHKRRKRLLQIMKSDLRLLNNYPYNSSSIKYIMLQKPYYIVSISKKFYREFATGIDEFKLIRNENPKQ
jgi:hypothetical protein